MLTSLNACIELSLHEYFTITTERTVMMESLQLYTKFLRRKSRDTWYTQTPVTDEMLYTMTSNAY